MKLNRSLLAHGIIASIAITGLAIAQQDGHDDPMNAQMPDPGAFKMILGDKDMNPETAMAEWMAIGQPGEPHQFLKKMEGNWNATMRMWWDPTAEPQESKGQATTKSIFGGRYFKHDLAIAMMGMPYEGLGYMGFDNNRRVFINTWMDSMSTGISVSKGSINREGDVLTFFGEMDEPGTGEVGKVYKMTYTFKGPDHFLFEMWEVMYGDPWKVFEIDYTRKN